jgi:hypothetical protein
MQVITLRLSDQLHGNVARQAAYQGVSMNTLLVQFVVEGLTRAGLEQAADEVTPSADALQSIADKLREM